LLSNVLVYVAEQGKMKIKKCSGAILICSSGLDHSVMLLHFLKAFIQLWKHGRLNYIQLCLFAKERIQTGNMARSNAR
jgi:hypothetical protein